MGTNGPGLAYYLNKPIIIEGSEHYIEKYHHITQMSVPLHDSQGNITGIIDITMPYDNFLISFYRSLLLITHAIERELKLLNFKISIDTYEVSEISEDVENNYYKINQKYLQLVDDHKRDIRFQKGIFDQPFIGIVHYTHPERRVLRTNKKYMEIVQDVIQSDSIDGMTFNEYAKDWIERDRGGDFWNERIATGKQGTLQELCIPKNGDNYYYNVDVQPIRKDDKIIGWLETITDVTTIRKAKKQLEEREKYISDIFDAFEIPVAVISYPDIKYKFVNKGFNELFNNMAGEKVRKSDIEGRDVLDVLHFLPDDNGFLSMINALGIEKSTQYVESMKMDYKDGRRRVYKVVYTPLFDDKGEVNSIIGSGMDITDEVEFTQAKDEFFTIISHELRSPTNIIVAAIQLLLTDKYQRELSPQLIKHIQRIKQNSFRLLRLINNFLDIQRSEAGFLNIFSSNVDFVGMTEALTNSTLHLAESKNIKISFHTDIEEKIIEIDIEKYERVLLNLLANATKFTPDGGEIKVSITETKGYIKLSIKDNGIGISKDKIDKIFDKFIRVDSSLSRTSEGTGLGLALVKLLVEKMGGKISVFSEEGNGAEFTLYFPYRQIESMDKIEPIKSIDEFEHITNIEFSDIYYL